MSPFPPPPKRFFRSSIWTRSLSDEGDIKLTRKRQFYFPEAAASAVLAEAGSVRGCSAGSPRKT